MGWDSGETECVCVYLHHNLVNPYPASPVHLISSTCSNTQTVLAPTTPNTHTHPSGWSLASQLPPYHPQRGELHLPLMPSWALLPPHRAPAGVCTPFPFTTSTLCPVCCLALPRSSPVLGVQQCVYAHRVTVCQ